ncbi:MobV family relaxase [Shewanella sp. SM32]|uniref:MobV family relaxase n=1 Tax=Shewanella sp. SM32 TaxID=2912796 RepID=UPI0021DA7B5E|nr:MobV family relaxase [Shewanella sp. SM32]MCU8072547.1 plasmid recombination protein [Shewanella sp. SM32]
MTEAAILRFSKIKSMRALRGALAHNLRVQNTPNANPAKGHLNKIHRGMDTIDKCLMIYGERLGEQTPRKNAIFAHEAVVTGSPDVINNMGKEQLKQYFSDSLNWLCKIHGGKDRLVSAVIHCDETTPHLQAIFIPIDDKGRLNSRAVLGGHKNRLSELQTEFADRVGARYGLERGRKKSPARHQSLAEWYGKEPEARAKYASLARAIGEQQDELAKLTNENKVLSSFNEKLFDENSSLIKQAEELRLANRDGLEALKRRISDLEAKATSTYRPRP